MIGVTISLFAMVHAGTPLALIVLLRLAQGLFNSLQFSSMNSMAYADIDTAIRAWRAHRQLDAAVVA